VVQRDHARHRGGDLVAHLIDDRVDVAPAAPLEHHGKVAAIRLGNSKAQLRSGSPRVTGHLRRLLQDCFDLAQQAVALCQ